MVVFAMLFGAFRAVKKKKKIHKLQCATVGILFSKVVHLSQGMCTKGVGFRDSTRRQCQQETAVQRMTVNY